MRCLKHFWLHVCVGEKAVELRAAEAAHADVADEALEVELLETTPRVQIVDVRVQRLPGRVPRRQLRRVLRVAARNM